MSIQVFHEGHWSRIVLNSPESKNALSLQMLRDLAAHARNLAQDSSLRVVLLEGAGAIFCAGAHLGEMKGSLHKTEQENRADASTLHQAFEALWSLPQILLVRVQGGAFGGALGLMAVGDEVLIEEDVTAMFSEVKLGLAPAVISDFIFRKLPSYPIGQKMLSADLISAQELVQLGLAHKLCAKGESERQSRERVKHYLQLGPQAVRETKKMIRSLRDTWSEPERRQYVTHLIARLRVSPEGQEGIGSFFEKRKPQWIVSSGEP